MSEGSLLALTLAEARDGLARKAFSARELAIAYNKAVKEAEPLNAYITPTPERALAMADAADQRLAQGKPLPLDGIPIAVKDLYCTKEVLTTAGSHILDGFRPPYESTVTAKLWRSGAVMLGKANLDEFAMGSSNTTSYYGPVENPWRRPEDNRPLVSGGSSGGSAAAVAARAALAATGTDTGGSVRQPASFCGIVGLKPTYGRCSRWGVVAYASSLDHPGPMTRTVRDAAILLRAMAGHDPRDSTSAAVPVPDFEAALTGDVRGLRVGIPQEYRAEGMPGEIESLWQQGVEWLRAAGFGAEVRRRVLIGTYVLSAGYYDAYFLKAQRVRAMITRDFVSAFERVDCILTPTAPSAAFAIGEKSEDPIAMYLNDLFTVPANLAGVPAISVPAGLSDDGLPLGLQITGRAFDEETVLRVAEVLESAAQFRHLPSFIAGGHS